MGGMALFARTRLDPELKEAAGRRRALASGTSPEGQVAGLVDALLFRQDGAWQEQPWHRIERGSWDAETHSLNWLDVEGRSWRLALSEPGQLPDFFNERVTASIACVRTADLGRGRTALITARRDLGDGSRPLVWRVSPGKGVRADELAQDPLVAIALDQLRAEFDAR